MKTKLINDRNTDSSRVHELVCGIGVQPVKINKHTDRLEANPTIRARRSGRRGAAAVEFAVCLPLLILLVFGSIEASSMIFLKQSLNVAAYEASREAIRRGKSNADASARAEAILDSRGTIDYRIDYPNGESFDVDRGEEVVTVVSAPSGANSPLVGQFIRSRVLSARVVMIKQ